LRTPFLFLLVCVACVSTTDEPAPSGATCPEDSPLTYENFGQAFVQAYCLRCHSETTAPGARHGAPSDTNFDTLAQLRHHAHHIDEWAAAGPSSVNTLMPPDGSAPSEEERRRLGEWLACGAP
jgi:uncharacterized membrane protein